MSLISPLQRVIKKRSASFWILFLGAVFIVVVGGLIYIDERKAVLQQSQTDREWSLIGRAIGPQDHTIGNISAPIQVIVYSDFECQYCKLLFESQIPKLQTVFGNQIVFAYRHRVLTTEPASEVEEEASECVYQAGGNNAFWKFATAMFDQSSSTNDRDMKVLTDIAVQAGVDPTNFATCMDVGAGKNRVAQDTLEASIAGIDQDPSFLLKSAHRALIVQGDYYSQIYSGIQYLLDTNKQIE
jgi:protein-disulfide isomerase